MQKREQIARERHVEIGDELHAMSEAITRLITELGEAAPWKSLAYDSARNASRSLLRLRSDLESLMMSQHPAQVDDVRVYFGQRVAKIEPAAYN